MYHSRLTLTNGLISAALDALTGEPLELVLESRRENILKSNFKQEASPLKVLLSTGQALRPAKYAEIRLDASLAPSIQLTQEADRAQGVIACPRLVDMDTGEAIDIAARWTLELPQGEHRMHWRITLENHTADMVEKCYFPYLNGIWMGDDWKADKLYMPVHSGDCTLNPTETLSAAPARISWKWQEYQFQFALGGPHGIRNEKTGCWERECSYSGPCSMLYMVLDNPALDMSVYLTCRNPALRLKTLRAATYGPTLPGVSLAIAHIPCLKAGVWEGEDCILMLSEGDWHQGADDYRRYRQSLPRPVISRPHRPDWFMKSPGLVAHYDFKYQGGGIVHHFRDIPQLYRQAESFGLHHLLLSGWHEGGFDNGFPMYTPSPDLGTEEELLEAVHEVRAAGGHVAFYINSRLCNTKYPQLTELWQQGAVQRGDGTPMTEKYGADELSFACMCTGSAPWRKKITETVTYLTKDIGADSMYLDQLGMAAGLMCHNAAHLHGEDLAAWNQGYEAMLASIRQTYDAQGMALLFEGASDIHAPGASGQLISTLFFAGAFPEMYKYTFPEDVLVDMMCPASHSAMRPAHLARKSTFLLYRAFCVGSYFWVYDLEEDNTFRRDPPQLARLKGVLALRQAWLEQYGHGRFTDTLDLLEVPQRTGVIAKTFRLEKGLLLACANESGQPLTVALKWAGEMPQARIRCIEHPEVEEPLALIPCPGGVRVAVGKTELCYVVVE